MQIFIPTYSRWQKDRARTLRNWHKEIPVTVVVQPQEYKSYVKLVGGLGLTKASIMQLPKKVKGIAMTRQWIVDYVATNINSQFSGDPYICMVDDDLEFLVRKDEDDWHLRGHTLRDTKAMFKMLEGWMKKGNLIHCAVSMREGNNRIEDNYIDIGRGIRLTAYNVQVLREIGVSFRTIADGKEDLDMTLQLLRRGYPNRVSYFYAQGQGSSNDPGGLSEYRDQKHIIKSSKTLAKLHPDFVKTVEKTTKGAWGGGTRLDVRVQWKKAYQSSGMY